MEKARQEGIRLLEVHVRLLKEARAALSSQNLGAKNKLMDEIDKVEKNIELWRKNYQNLYLRGNNLWDLIAEEEELDRNRKMGQKTTEKADDKIKTENSPQKLKETKKRNLQKDRYEKEEGEEIIIHEEQRAISSKELTSVSMFVKENGKSKNDQIMNQEASQLKENNKKVEETFRSYEEEEKSQKRQLEYEMKDSNESIKRKKCEGAETSVARQTKGHRVLVQNISLSVQYTELRAYFSKFGPVSKVYLKIGTGSGFVIYESEDIADFVCSLQHRLGEQEVRVMKDTTRQQPSAGPAPAGQDYAVFVFGVTTTTDSQLLRSAMATFGPVKNVSRPAGKNYAFVTFERESSMEAALQARKVPFNGVTLVIRRTKTCSEKGKSREDGAVKEAAVVTSAKPKKGFQVFLCGITIPMDLQGFQMGLAQFGSVVYAYMPEDKNYAFVGFDTQEAQHAALEAGAVNLPSGRAIIRPAMRQ